MLDESHQLISIWAILFCNKTKRLISRKSSRTILDYPNLHSPSLGPCRVDQELEIEYFEVVNFALSPVATSVPA